MTCYLALQQSGHLQKNDGSGFLLLNICIEQTGGAAGKDYKPVHVQRYEYQQEQKRLEAKRLKKQEKLDLAEKALAAVEKKRTKHLADQELQAEYILYAREADKLQRQIEALNLEILMLWREEDDILCLLYSLPFMT